MCFPGQGSTSAPSPSEVPKTNRANKNPTHLEIQLRTLLTATTLIYATGARITAAAGARTKCPWKAVGRRGSPRGVTWQCPGTFRGGVGGTRVQVESGTWEEVSIDSEETSSETSKDMLVFP